MAATLTGPLGSTVTVSLGSTGVPIVSVSDPAYPTGGWNGPLDATEISNSIKSFQSSINDSDASILQIQIKIDQLQTNPAAVFGGSYSPQDVSNLLASYNAQIQSNQNRIALHNNSITFAQYLSDNLSTLVQQASAPTADPVQPDNANTTTNTSVTTTDTSVSTGSDGNSADNPTDPQQPATASSAIPETQGTEIVVNGNPDEVTPGSLDDSVFAENAGVSDDTSIPEDDTAPPIDGMPPEPRSAVATWNGAQDLRVKLRVPESYLVGPAAGPSDVLLKNGGILFPYTPSISMDNKAEYAQQTPLHSNFAQYFYKHSMTGPISISAKFTVQNEQEGAILLGIIHLLRALTKMRFGDDPQKGSPPPVCRLDAYGDYMLYNVPVAVASWKHDLPDGIDYITVGRPGNPTTYGVTMVPVLSTINIDLNIMYSRQEMLNHNVPGWLNGDFSGQGYL